MNTQQRQDVCLAEFICSPPPSLLTPCFIFFSPYTWRHLSARAVANKNWPRPISFFWLGAYHSLRNIVVKNIGKRAHTRFSKSQGHFFFLLSYFFVGQSFPFSPFDELWNLQRPFNDLEINLYTHTLKQNRVASQVGQLQVAPISRNAVRWNWPFELNHWFRAAVYR